MRLAGRHLVLTRPEGQNEKLARRLRAEGAEVFEFPVTRIEPLADPAPLLELASRLADFDLAFFVSPNAVAHAFAGLPPGSWPSKLKVATIGPASAQALRAQGFEAVIAPEQRFDSEAVLELPDFSPEAISGRRVLILRGNGGRDLLAETLKARGAEVEVVSCYERQQAHLDPAPLLDAHVDGIVFSNSEAIAHFIAITGEAGREMLARLPVFAPHPRILEAARSCGAHRAMLTAAGDEGIVSGILETLGPVLG